MKEKNNFLASTILQYCISVFVYTFVFITFNFSKYILTYRKTDSVLWLLRTIPGVIHEVCSRISLSLGVNGISGKEFRCDDTSKLLPPKERDVDL